MLRAPSSILVSLLVLASGRASADEPTATPTSGSEASPAPARVFFGIERVVSAGATNVADERTSGPEQYPHGGASMSVPLGGWSMPAAGYTFVAPRLAVDVVASGPLTIGLAGFYLPTAGESHGDTYVRAVKTHATVWGAGPRVGVLLCNDSRLCFWGRGGLTYAGVDAVEDVEGATKGGPLPTGQHADYRSLSLGLEPTLLVGVTRHFAMTLGLTIDRTLTATRTDASGTHDAAATSANLNVGGLGWL